MKESLFAVAWFIVLVFLITVISDELLLTLFACVFGFFIGALVGNLLFPKED